MLKMRFPFPGASTSLDTKTFTIASNSNFESCPSILSVDSLSCSSAHFAFFPFLPQVLPLPSATLLTILSPSSTFHWAIEIKKMCLQWVTFPGKSWSIVIDARRSRCPNGLRFQEAWRASCLRTFMRLKLAFELGRNTTTLSEFIGYVDSADFRQISPKHSRNNDKRKGVGKFWYFKYLRPFCSCCGIRFLTNLIEEPSVVSRLTDSWHFLTRKVA